MNLRGKGIYRWFPESDQYLVPGVVSERRFDRRIVFDGMLLTLGPELENLGPALLRKAVLNVDVDRRRFIQIPIMFLPMRALVMLVPRAGHHFEPTDFLAPIVVEPHDDLVGVSVSGTDATFQFRVGLRIPPHLSDCRVCGVFAQDLRRVTVEGEDDIVCADCFPRLASTREGRDS